MKREEYWQQQTYTATLSGSCPALRVFFADATRDQRLRFVRTWMRLGFRNDLTLPINGRERDVCLWS